MKMDHVWLERAKPAAQPPQRNGASSIAGKRRHFESVARQPAAELAIVSGEYDGPMAAVAQAPHEKRRLLLAPVPAALRGNMDHGDGPRHAGSPSAKVTPNPSAREGVR